MLKASITLLFLLFFISGQFFIIRDFLKGKNYTHTKGIAISIWIFLSINSPIIFNAYLVLKAEQAIPIITLSVTILELGVCVFGFIGIYNFIRKNCMKFF